MKVKQLISRRHSLAPCWLSARHEDNPVLPKAVGISLLEVGGKDPRLWF
jgi:hypothetical protein